MEFKSIKSALISVFSKNGLEPILKKLVKNNITIYSTGGTQKFIESLGFTVIPVENITSYPSILDGRVKTLHPKVFGGILAKREAEHLAQLEKYEIPQIDLVIVDLYPFEETVKQTNDESAIIEKIDIGGISLIRAAAKNFNDVVVIASKDDYQPFIDLIDKQGTKTNKEQRKTFAKNSFAISSNYDTQIFQYFNDAQTLRYGENPHQEGIFYGNLEDIFLRHSEKKLSYNNLVDIDAAVNVMSEFKDDKPTFAVLKHTNTCGLATKDNLLSAWKSALAGDPVSAFGGILISNTKIDLETAKEISKIFYEVLIAPKFSKDALDFLTKNKRRSILTLKKYPNLKQIQKSILNGIIVQDKDAVVATASDLQVVTNEKPNSAQIEDLLFAEKAAKHLKSNTIVIAKDKQLIGMGCGQTSRVDALNQAIIKAKAFGFDLNNSVMASDAFFPFPDCVEIGFNHGVTAVVQPGGSIKDQLSIDYCNENKIPMVFTGKRHFKH